MITLEAVHNFRDLGGYPTEDGRVTRWRTLFRADGLQRLADADLEVVRALGIHTVIDLRTHLELAERGTFPVDVYPVAFHHLPVIDVTWDPGEVADPTAPMPTSCSTSTSRCSTWASRPSPRPSTCSAVPGALPAVFHCAAGKDRTGLLAALLLSALGVSDEDVVADYALTEAAMDRMMALVRAAQPGAGCGRDRGAAVGLHGGRAGGHGWRAVARSATCTAPCASTSCASACRTCRRLEPRSSKPTPLLDRLA